MLTSRERMIATLDHREPDRVPFDLGSTYTTGIHHVAYRALRRYLGLPGDGRIMDIKLGLGFVDDDVRDRLGVDAGIVSPNGPNPERWRLDVREAGNYLEYTDEYGLGWRSPLKGGLYYDLCRNPLAGDITVADVEAYPWPDPADPHRFEGMRERALRVRDDERRATVFRGVATGIFELASWMRGHEQFFMDLLEEPALAEAILDKALEIKIDYWARVFEVAGDLVDVTYDADDYGTQRDMFISPATWRTLIKPRLATLNAFIHANSGAKVFFHSCGAIRKIIPDLIEVGVDALNPVQVSAASMDSGELKREFGRDIVFWGGGVDTQHTLPAGSPQDVRDEVRRRLDDLMPGGGFVFTAVHSVQADVSPENFMAMWETVRDYGSYHG